MAFDFSQYPSVSMDPSQAIPNTGVTGYGPGGVTPPAIDQTGLVPPTMAQQQTNNTNAQPAPSPTGAQDPKAYFDQIFPGPNLSPQDLLAHEADLKAHGITLIKNAAGLPGKVQLADGSAFDVIRGAGAGLNQKAWDPIGGDTGGGVNGSAGTTLGNLGYSFGSSMAPFTGQFAAPTAAEAQATPGVQFGLDEANRMMQNSGAAHGTLLNGRFQQALAASNIGNALQDYGNIYNRALSTFGTNYGIFKDNQDRPFDKNLSLAQLGKPA